MFSPRNLPYLDLLLREEISGVVLKPFYEYVAYVLNANTGSAFQGFEVAETLRLNEIQILLGVKIGSVVPRLEVQLVVIAIKLIEVVHGDVVIELLTQADTCLVGPAPCHILDSVATSSKHQKREVPRLDEAHTVAMISDRGVIVS